MTLAAALVLSLPMWGIAGTYLYNSYHWSKPMAVYPEVQPALDDITKIAGALSADKAAAVAAAVAPVQAQLDAANATIATMTQDKADTVAAVNGADATLSGAFSPAQ